jgi:glucokinase
LPDKLIIGIDLGGTNIKGVLIDTNGRSLVKHETATQANSGPEHVASRIGSMVTALESEAAKDSRAIIGVGIGVPGLPDQKTGEVVFAPNLQWKNVPIVQYLAKQTALPIILENDANLAALGELWLGAGRGSVNMIMITIGTGIGGGIIINGCLYSGTNGNAGEIGHTVIDHQGPLCSCGRRGCLETYASATAIVRMAKEAVESGKATGLAKVENLQAKDIFSLAQTGDELSKDIINSAAYYLGIGLGNLINLFNPDTIVVGGGVSRAGDILFDPLRRSAMQWSMEAPAKVVKIVPAQLGNDAGSIGAARLVIQAKS